MGLATVLRYCAACDHELKYASHINSVCCKAHRRSKLLLTMFPVKECGVISDCFFKVYVIDQS